MVLFLVTFLSCLLKFSIAFVVYISFLIPLTFLLLFVSGLFLGIKIPPD